MSFDNIYVNNTALDAAFVSFSFLFNLPSWNQVLYCQGYLGEHV